LWQELAGYFAVLTARADFAGERSDA
jgi:hypothetical protein